MDKDKIFKNFCMVGDLEGIKKLFDDELSNIWLTQVINNPYLEGLCTASEYGHRNIINYLVEEMQKNNGIKRILKADRNYLNDCIVEGACFGQKWHIVDLYLENYSLAEIEAFLEENRGLTDAGTNYLKNWQAYKEIKPQKEKIEQAIEITNRLPVKNKL